jgi:hypothetical protein
VTPLPDPVAPGHPPRPPLPRRLAPVIGLLLLSPICAEYLIGYDESIGRPLELAAGLLILAPLYGAVAVLIREVTRRAGRGWPTILLLGAAFGLIQAGLIDQSLFHIEFDEDDPVWATERPTTIIPGLGVDAGNLVNWVGGHTIWSFAAPIAVVEAFVPGRADRPWLGRAGLSVMVVLYLMGAALILSDVADGATAAQMIGTAVVVTALAVVAFAIPRRSAIVSGRVPPPWLVGLAAVAVLATHQLLPQTWVGVAVDVLALTLLGAMLLHWSGRTPWGRKHVLAAGGAALVVNAGLSFTVEPLGNPSPAGKYVSNTVITVGVIALLAWAHHRLHRAGTTTGTQGGETHAPTPRRASS